MLVSSPELNPCGGGGLNMRAEVFFFCFSLHGSYVKRKVYKFPFAKKGVRGKNLWKQLIYHQSWMLYTEKVEYSIQSKTV